MRRWNGAFLAAVFLACAAIIAGPKVAAAQTTVEDLRGRIDALADSLAARGEFSGVIAVAREGKIVISRTAGLSNREAGTPNRVDTAFNLGSINKLFTWIAVRQLVADGKLNLDTTLVTILPDYPNREVARSVTIRQLLDHESGLGGDVFDAPAGGTRMDLRHNRDFLPLFAGEPPLFAPGTDRRYCNAGYVVLGLVVERVSGRDYYDYIREHVYAPAGLSPRTGHAALDSLPPNTAIGYTRGEETLEAALTPNTHLLPGRGSAAGGGYSTAEDLLRFMQALREGKVPAGPPPGIGVAGGSPGCNAVLEGDHPGGYDLVVLTNLDPPGAETIAETIRGWLGAED